MTTSIPAYLSTVKIALFVLFIQKYGHNFCQLSLTANAGKSEHIDNRLEVE